jgi:hypothetical protein
MKDRMIIIFECVREEKNEKKLWLVYTRGYRGNSPQYELTQRGLEAFVQVENRNADVTIYDPYGDSI